MHNADCFAAFPATPSAPATGPNQNDVGSRRRLRAARLRIREDAVVSQCEPSGSPSLAVVSPLVEDPSHASAGADVRSSDIGVRSTSGEIHRGASSQERRLRRPLPDPRTLQRYAAKRVHLLHPHRACAYAPTQTNPTINVISASNSTNKCVTGTQISQPFDNFCST